MREVTITNRKDDHIRINLEEDVRFRSLTTGLEDLRFEHQALPELDLDEIDLSAEFLHKKLEAPMMISSMTGGTDGAQSINRTLAAAAEQAGIALGLGSMRVALEHPEVAASFQVRDVAPNALIFANLGAIQLNYGFGVEHCKKVVEMAAADALILHFNPVQEALQPEGDTNFSGLLRKVEVVCTALRDNGVPVVAKEVGWGFSERNCRQLAEAGIAAIDVAGAGGTSWSQVEMHRAPTASHAHIAAAFEDWGIPTVRALRNALAGAPELPIIASGGLRNGVDIAKCIALGASLAAMAKPFLEAAVISMDSVLEVIHDLKQMLRISMLCTGASDITSLKHIPLLGLE